MNGEFLEALEQIANEKEISLDMVIETVEGALATAIKRNSEINGEVKVTLDAQKGKEIPFKVYCEKQVVDEVTDECLQISLPDARRINPEILEGETLAMEVEVRNLSRIIAQTVKQVLMQRIRETERRRTYEEYNGRVGEVVTGTVQRREGRNVIIGLGKVDALLPIQEQVESEPYRFNDRIKVYVLEVRETNRGPQVIVSRTHPSLIRRLFEVEVPEIADGTVTIQAVAREPGARSKIAVHSRDEKVDPVGACVGHRGSRVQAVVNELYDEKIDIIRWNVDPGLFIGEALSPAKAVHVTVNPDLKSAHVEVPDNQLSLAIGKAGQNVRLAARLTGWRIDIRSESQIARAKLMAVTEGVEHAPEDEPPVTIGERRPPEELEAQDDIVIGSASVSHNGHVAEPAESVAEAAGVGDQPGGESGAA